MKQTSSSLEFPLLNSELLSWYFKQLLFYQELEFYKLTRIESGDENQIISWTRNSKLELEKWSKTDVFYSYSIYVLAYSKK